MAYAVAAFMLLEVVSNVAPVFNFPGWIAQAVILLLLLLLPGGGVNSIWKLQRVE